MGATAKIIRSRSKVKHGLKRKQTQESVVGVRLEKFFRAVQVESERQEDLDVGLLLQQSWVDSSWVGVLQLVHANGVVATGVALSVQWVHNLS